MAGAADGKDHAMDAQVPGAGEEDRNRRQEKGRGREREVGR